MKIVEYQNQNDLISQIENTHTHPLTAGQVVVIVGVIAFETEVAHLGLNSLRIVRFRNVKRRYRITNLTNCSIRMTID